MGTILLAIAYAMKGGQLKIHYGKLFSALLVFAYSVQFGFVHAIIFTIAWILAVHPSMGEEAGAIGNFRYGWGKYIDWMPWVKEVKLFGREFKYTEGRWFGINKALQRGAWMGSMFTLATLLSPAFNHDLAYIFLSLIIIFPLAHFIAQGIYYSRTVENNWKGAEPIIGGMIGLCCDMVMP